MMSLNVAKCHQMLHCCIATSVSIQEPAICEDLDLQVAIFEYSSHWNQNWYTNRSWWKVLHIIIGPISIGIGVGIGGGQCKHTIKDTVLSHHCTPRHILKKLNKTLGELLTGI